jgi:nucleoside-diphosphate-sugar epimerase
MHENPVILSDLDDIIAADLPWENLCGKTVLVSGAAGFLPAYMVKTLLHLNHRSNSAPIRVVGLVRNLEKSRERFLAYASDPNLEFWEADLNQQLTYPGKLDIIIHAASQASPKYYGTDPIGTLSANVLGTYHLLDLASRKQVSRFLFFSSSEVYGVPPEPASIREDQFGPIDPTQVRSCYAESKRMGETICVSFLSQKQVPALMVRPFHTYGPGLHLDDGRVFADFIASIVRKQDIVMNSDGSAVRSFCYLADATLGFFTVLLKGKPGEAYNVGNPECSVSIRELAQTLVGLYPDLNLKAVFKSTGSTGSLASTFQQLCPDISKIQNLGWKPVTDIATGFKKSVDSFVHL